MKARATGDDDCTEDDRTRETPFARFTRNMRALMAVPKKELDAKIAAVRRQRKRAKA